MSESGTEIIPALPTPEFLVPAIIAAAGDKASEHFLEFFAATIRNPNTRAAYVQAIAQFCRWCEEYKLELTAIRRLHVAAYIESKSLSAPAVKRMCCKVGRSLFDRVK